MIPTHVQFEISYLNRVMQFCIMPSKVELSDNFFSLETRPHLCPPCKVLVHLLHWGPIWGLLHIQNWALLSPFTSKNFQHIYTKIFKLTQLFIYLSIYYLCICTGSVSTIKLKMVGTNNFPFWYSLHLFLYFWSLNQLQLYLPMSGLGYKTLKSRT